MYQKEYDSLLVKKLGYKFKKVITKVVLVPNTEQLKNNETINERKQQIQRQFSAWDGAHKNLEKYVKANMHGPGSYKHVQTDYEDKGEYILVQTTFRGRNALGEKVLNEVIAKVDLDGNVLSIVSQR